MRTLSPHDDPCPVRVASQVDQAGQLGDLRALAQGAVLFECGTPELFGQGSDRLADRLGDGVSDGEGGEDPAGAQGPHMLQERFRSAGTVRADEEGCAVAVGVGDLGKCLVEDGDVVGGGVGAGVSRPQQAGQGFAGVVQEAQQRVVAETAFVGRRCLLLLGVAGHQGGVEVQDQAGQVMSARAGCGYPRPGLGGLQPGDLAGGGPGRAQAGECGWVDAGRQAPGGRRGGDGTEHLRLVAQQGQVRYRIAAVGEHDREIDRDPAGVMPGATRSQPTQCTQGLAVRSFGCACTMRSWSE